MPFPAPVAVGDRSVRSSPGPVRVALLAVLAVVAVLLSSWSTSTASATAGGTTGTDGVPMELTFAVDATGRRAQLPFGRVGDDDGKTVRVAVDWGDDACDDAGETLDFVTTVGTASCTYPGGDVGTRTVRIWPLLADEGGSDTEPWLEIYGLVEGDGTSSIALAGLPTNAAGNHGDLARLTAVNAWGELGTTSLSSAFSRHHSLTSVPASLPSTVTDLSGTFNQASDFDGAGVTGWDTAEVTNMQYLFAEAEVFNQDIGGWNTAKVTDMQYLFQEAYEFDQDIGGWNTALVTTMSRMFDGATSFDQPIGDWNTAKVTDMQNMFQGADAFNQDLGSWNVSSVTIMDDMFEGTDNFNNGDSDRIKDWNFVKLDSVDNMFENAAAFNQPIGSWNMSTVTDFGDMFKDSGAFDQDLGGWDLSSATDMNDMFEDAAAFNNGGSPSIGDWDVSGVDDRMSSMFAGAVSFDQSLGGWDLNPDASFTSMLSGSGMSVSCFDATLNGWAELEVTGLEIGADGLVRSTDSDAAYKKLTRLTTADPPGLGWSFEGFDDDAERGEPDGNCVTPTAAPAPSGPRVTLASAPSAVGDPVVAEVSGGDPGIDILWRLVGPDGATLREGPVTLDGSGAGTITTTLPSAATGGYRLVLVAWGAEAQFAVGTASGPVPTGVPAGEEPSRDGSVPLVLALLVALAVAVLPWVRWPGAPERR